jgi:hypothetical protein
MHLAIHLAIHLAAHLAAHLPTKAEIWSRSSSVKAFWK